MIDVLVADDHELVRFGIVRMLQDVEDICVVGQATSGEEAVDRARSLCPDIVLMDVRMPGIGGLEAMRRILASVPTIRVIAVSACEEEPFPSRFLKDGAAGYVSKASSFEDIVAAIRQVHSGRRYLSDGVAQRLALSQFEPAENSPFARLSQRELQICMMVVNCARVQDISEQLHLSPKTVNSYRYRIFEKLGVSSDVELTLLALKYRMVDVPQV